MTWLVTLLVVGVALIASSQLTQLHHTLLGEILRDLGIAVCVSVVIARLIELSLSQDIFLSGLDAIMMRTVPKDVWEDFRQHVITQPIMHENWSVRMTIAKEGDGPCVSTTSLTYSIISLEDALVTNTQIELDVHRTPSGAPNRFTRATIAGQSYNSNAELFSAKLLSSDGLTLQLPVRLDKRDDKRSVEIEFKELINCPDVIVWWMRRVTRDVTVKIEKIPESWSVDVQTFHPARRQLVKDVEHENEWKFSGIMLPGQGIEIRMKALAELVKP